MAYYSGVAENWGELRQALLDACTAEGWTWHSTEEVLEKTGLFLRVPPPGVDYWGVTGRTSLTAGDMPNSIGIGNIYRTGTGGFERPVTFPAPYEVFAFDQEVFFVVNYDVDFYQWLAFGKSTVSGMPGTGMWVSGTRAATAYTDGVTIQVDGSSSGNSTAMFYNTNGNTYSRTGWVHSDLDGQGWWTTQTLGGSPPGIRPLRPLLEILPNTWDNEAVLLPIRAYKVRPSNRNSLVADIENARHTRVDYYEPGQVIQIGHERWKVLPWFRKNASSRNGGTWTDHTGTFGWAIRYEGP